MKQHIRSLGAATLVVSAVAVFAVVPVFAERGSTEVSPRHVALSSDGSTDSSGDDSIKTRRTEEDIAEFKKKAQELIQSKRAEQKEKFQEKTAEQRKKVCESRSAGINKRFTNFGTAANRHLNKINSAYDKITAYQEKNNLDVSDYDALVAAANEKKQAATDAAAALEEINAGIDCSSTDPATSIASVKTAVRTARETLKDYRKSVKDILVALRTAKESNSDNGTGSTDSSNENDSTTNTTEGQ